MSKLPVLSDANAMNRRSGDHVTSVCNPDPNVRRVRVRWTGAALRRPSLPACPWRTAHHAPPALNARTLATSAAATLCLVRPALTYSALDCDRGVTSVDAGAEGGVGVATDAAPGSSTRPLLA